MTSSRVVTIFTFSVMCLSLQFKVVHFKAQYRKVNVIMHSSYKNCVYPWNTVLFEWWEWLRTSCRADNFSFCTYSSIWINWLFFFIYLKLLIALMLILKSWFSWNPMFALCIFIGSLHILDYMHYSLSCHCLLKCRFDPASIELAL